MKIWAKTKEFFEGKFLVVRRDGSVPHWPSFLLGARDEAAAIALRYYARACQALGYEADYVKSLGELADDFDAYRRQEGSGDPEAPPHREDDPAVIAAMRGSNSTITVRPDKFNVPKSHDI